MLTNLVITMMIAALAALTMGAVCLLSPSLAANTSARRLRWIGWSLIGISLPTLLYPGLQTALTPCSSEFELRGVRVQTITPARAFDIGMRTVDPAVSEGPCPDGCEGGILRGLDSAQEGADIGLTVPEYKPQSESILWTYEWRPTKLLIERDRLGSGRVLVVGHEEAGSRLYYWRVPTRILPDGPMIEFRDQNG